MSSYKIARCCLVSGNFAPLGGGRTMMIRRGLRARSGEVVYRLPAPLGRWAFVPPGALNAEERLAFGPHEGDYPFLCNAGLLGDSDRAADQSSPACTRPCPIGHSCSPGSSVAVPCPNGTFCPLGSPSPRDCPPGYWGDRPMLESASECTMCVPGTYCPDGSPDEIPCPIGTFTAASASRRCAACETGYFANEEGLTACQNCAPGHW